MSYLPLLQYDATLSGPVNKRKLKVEMLSFNFRSVLSFRTMGVFFPRFRAGIHVREYISRAGSHI